MMWFELIWTIWIQLNSFCLCVCFKSRTVFVFQCWWLSVDGKRRSLLKWTMNNKPDGCFTTPFSRWTSCLRLISIPSWYPFLHLWVTRVKFTLWCQNDVKGHNLHLTTGVTVSFCNHSQYCVMYNCGTVLGPPLLLLIAAMFLFLL